MPRHTSGPCAAETGIAGLVLGLDLLGVYRPVSQQTKNVMTIAPPVRLAAAPQRSSNHVLAMVPSLPLGAVDVVWDQWSCWESNPGPRWFHFESFTGVAGFVIRLPTGEGDGW